MSGITKLTINLMAGSTYNLNVYHGDQFIWREEIKGWENVPPRIERIMPFLFQDDPDFDNIEEESE